MAANDKGVKSGKEKSDDDKSDKNKDWKGKCGKADKQKGSPICTPRGVFTLNMAEACPSAAWCGHFSDYLRGFSKVCASNERLQTAIDGSRWWPRSCKPPTKPSQP